MTAGELIQILNLEPLPGEGGFYRETYRSMDVVPRSALPNRYGQDKAAATCIFYLLTADTVSLLHRLPTDEIYHFYLGDPVTMLQLSPDSSGDLLTLGSDLTSGQQIQTIVPAGVWQGSFLAEGGRFALMGTTMAPGFDFSDYEPGDRDILTTHYPNRTTLIRKLT